MRAKYGAAELNYADCSTLKEQGRSEQYAACVDAGGKIYLEYELQNTTDYDYELKDSSNVEIMKRDKVLKPTFWRLVFPVFVPAHRTATIEIKSPNPCPGCNPADLKPLVEDISGVVLFDHNTRYEIELPKPIP
jgi:hypothetical protein